VTRPIPSELVPPISAPTKKPSMDDLKKLAIKIHRGQKTVPNMNWIPAPLTPTPNNGKYSLTLWHEGFAGYPWSSNTSKNKIMLKQYFKTMTDFVGNKNIDRVFLQSGDPALTDNYGDHKYNYADIDFVVENYLSKLPENTTAGLLAIVDPRYTTYYDITTPGGIWGNNPDYKDSPKGPYYCQAPYRECKAGDAKCAGNILGADEKLKCTQENCKSIDPNKPYCVGNNCSKFPACGIKKYYGGGKPSCLQFGPGCPNNIEQFFKYVGDLNEAAKKANVKPVTTIALDGEDLGMYGADPYGLVQLWQAARKYAPDINEIGYAKGASTNALSNWTNAAYPELYWIGELKKAVNCTGCPSSLIDKSSPGCQECKKSIYQTERNNPKGMVDAMSKYITKDYSEPGVCPLFSLENAHFSDNCIANAFNPINFCGTFDGFGSWSWDQFSKFLDLFAKTYNAKDIGIYEFQFLPISWLSDDTRQQINNITKERLDDSSGSSDLTWLWITLGVLALAIAVFLIIRLTQKRRK